MPPAAASDLSSPILPDYDGACISRLVPFLTGQIDDADEFLPPWVRAAEQVVLLVLDGLGWEQLRARPSRAPFLTSGSGIERPITSVTPTTTAAALTSITTGVPPSRHGILGYRLAVGDQILNTLRWTLGTGTGGDARRTVPIQEFQPLTPFASSLVPVPVVSKSDFGGTGFTAAHLGNSPLYEYRAPSSLPLEVGRALSTGAPLVYAYYDGIDRIAHAYGLAEHYDAELQATDAMVSEVAASLPAGAVLVVTADHGQVDVGTAVETVGSDAMNCIRFFSGEGRFRWLHAHPGAAPDLLAVCQETYGSTTWVRSRSQLIDQGWFGGPLSSGFEARLGDVALIPFEPIAFADPADTGENRLVSRHGSLTSAEMHVPLLSFGGERL